MLAEKIENGLYRIRIPFEDLTTTVYFAVYETGTVIIDSATYALDADHYILPALCELGINKEDVRFLALTHTHGDHAGGIARLAECLPVATVRAFSQPKHPAVPYTPLADGEVLLGGLQVLHLPGHTQTCVGYYDLQTQTLLSGDCLQLRGIGKYRNGVVEPDLYVSSIRRLQNLPIRRIVAAHEYDPLGSLAEGKAAVARYLQACLDAIKPL